jgi:carbon storage regulator
MLVLTCKIGERVVLPGLEAQIAVLSIKGKAVRLGVEAPQTVAVHRAEVCNRAARDVSVLEASER